jgi:hypothetical protein
MKRQKMASTMTHENLAFATPSSSLVLSSDPLSPPATPRPTRPYLSISTAGAAAGFEGATNLLPNGLFMPQLDHSVIDFDDSRVPSLLLAQRRRKSPVSVTSIHHEQQQRPLTVRPRITITTASDMQIVVGDDDEVQDYNNTAASTTTTTTTVMNDMEQDDDDIPFLDPFWNTLQKQQQQQEHGKVTAPTPSCFSSLKFLPYSTGRRLSHSSMVFPVPERN